MTSIRRSSISDAPSSAGAMFSGYVRRTKRSWGVTLREQLERERQRADQEHREQDQAEEEARTLRKELEEASRPWWRRWFS
jgi:hypothetical protein